MYPKFWKWFFYGLTGPPGYRSLLSRYIFLDAFVGVFVSLLLSEDLSDFSPKVLVPLSGILVGLSLSWVGTAMALFRDQLIEGMLPDTKDGIAPYIYKFQLSILVSLVVIVAWAFASANSIQIYDPILWTYNICTPWPVKFSVSAAELCLFALSSFFIRITWQTILGAHALLLTRNLLISEIQRTRENDQFSP